MTSKSWFLVTSVVLVASVSIIPTEARLPQRSEKPFAEKWEAPSSIKGFSDNIQIASSQDQKSSSTGLHHHGLGFGEGLGHHGKFFQYAHNPDYGAYEFGYRRGNDYHFQERYEKAHDWKFKTKVKWGDKYGGYGEHYWDYNHADKSHGGGGDHHGGSGDHHGGYDDGHHGHGQGHYSEQVPIVAESPGSPTKKDRSRPVHKRESRSEQIEKSIVPDVVGDEAPKLSSRIISKCSLSLDRSTGKITDERTGKSYWLKPTSS